MKNILVPTTLQHDTLYSVKAAIKLSAGAYCVITLVLLSEAPDAESAAYYLRKTKHASTTLQAKVLDNCRKVAYATGNCSLEIHNQYGLSAPLLKHLLEHLGTNLIIIPASYKQESGKINHYFLGLLANSRVPMLHMAPDCEEKDLNKALYLEHDKTQLDVQQLQQHINGQFSFKIVSHATVGEYYPEQLGQQITEAISKNNIDLLIETRKPEKIRKKNKGVNVNDTLGLPVLSIYEEAVL